MRVSLSRAADKGRRNTDTHPPDYSFKLRVSTFSKYMGSGAMRFLQASLMQINVFISAKILIFSLLPASLCNFLH